MERVPNMQNEVAEIPLCCCRNTEVLLQKSLNSVVQPIWLSSRLVFHGSRLVSHGSRLAFMVPGWFFMVLGRFFMVPGGFFFMFFIVPGWFFMGLGQFFMVNMFHYKNTLKMYSGPTIQSKPCYVKCFPIECIQIMVSCAQWTHFKASASRTLHFSIVQPSYWEVEKIKEVLKEYGKKI